MLCCEDEEIKLKSEELSPRYEDISPIKGTQQFHGFIPQSCDQIEVKTISKNVGKIVSLKKNIEKSK